MIPNLIMEIIRRIVVLYLIRQQDIELHILLILVVDCPFLFWLGLLKLFLHLLKRFL